MSTWGDEPSDYLQRIAVALESIAENLEKFANPPIWLIQPGDTADGRH